MTRFFVFAHILRGYANDSSLLDSFTTTAPNPRAPLSHLDIGKLTQLHGQKTSSLILEKEIFEACQAKHQKKQENQKKTKKTGI